MGCGTARFDQIVHNLCPQGPAALHGTSTGGSIGRQLSSQVKLELRSLGTKS